jgi:hypothetical protein
VSAKYDIFRRQKNGEFVWIETLDDFETAKTHMCRAASRLPGNYIVFDRQRVSVVAASIPRDEVIRKPEGMPR